MTEELKKELDKLISDKKKVISILSEGREKFESEKKARDLNNKKVKEAKEKRAKIFDEIKDLRKKLEKYDKELELISDKIGSFRGLKKEYDELNWKYQTGVFTQATEKKIVKRLDELEEKLEFTNEFKNVKQEHIRLLKRLRKLRAEASVQHDFVTKHASESEKHHSELVKIYEQREKAEKKLKEINEKMNALKSQLGEEYLKRRKEKTDEKSSISREKKEIAESQREKMKAKAKLIQEKFKKGEKVSLQELALLEEFGLY